MSKPFGSLKVNPWQWGKDGEPELYSDIRPAQWEEIKAGKSNVGWGEFVKFDVDPNDADGAPIAESDVPGHGLPRPVVSVQVRLYDEAGTEIGRATLKADPYGQAEGEVEEGNPVHINMRHYDESHGFGIKVICGNQSNPHSEFKPANSGRCRVEVDFTTQGVTGSSSYYVS